jgi:hypothetical protein
LAPRKYDAETLAKELNKYINENDDPRIVGFCIEEGRPCRDTLYELAKNCKSLSDTITRAKMKCELYLTGADCSIHPKIAGIRLATNHNMVERQIVDNNISGKLDVTSDPAEVEKRIQELLAKMGK